MSGEEGQEGIYDSKNEDRKAQIQIESISGVELGKLQRKEEIKHFRDQFYCIINV